jgi:hypothetical protein
LSLVMLHDPMISHFRSRAQLGGRSIQQSCRMKGTVVRCYLLLEVAFMRSHIVVVGKRPSRSVRVRLAMPLALPRPTFSDVLDPPPAQSGPPEPLFPCIAPIPPNAPSKTALRDFHPCLTKIFGCCSLRRTCTPISTQLTEATSLLRQLRSDVVQERRRMKK